MAIPTFLGQAHQLLRFGATPGMAVSARPLTHLVGYVVLGGAVYGAVMATYGGLADDRPLQVLYSALKVPLLLLATFALTIPAFFVFNTLVGLRDDFAAVVQGLLAAQAGLAIVLVALAPYTLLMYASSDSYHAASFFNALMFTLAASAAQVLLWRHYRPLVARNPRHAWMAGLWLFLYAFVGIQMCWVLRPFLGWPDQPVTFFRKELWDNAYVILLQKYWRLLFGPG
jgi:hypothetical protein